MKNNNLIVFCLFILFLLGFLYAARTTIINHIIDRYSANRVDTVVKDTTIWKYDSIEITKPVPKYIYKVKTDTVFTDKGDEVILTTENKTYKDTITTCAGDTMEVTSYISGINAVQDSLKVKLSKQEKIRTVEVTKYLIPPKKPLDHFKIGVGVGYGIGIKSRQFEPYVGISFNYNL